MDAKAIAVFVVIGIVAGWLASLLVGGPSNIIAYLIAGVIGAFVGGFLLNALNIRIGTGNAIVNQIITSAIGAVVVIILARLIL